MPVINSTGLFRKLVIGRRLFLLTDSPAHVWSGTPDPSRILSQAGETDQVNTFVKVICKEMQKGKFYRYSRET